MKKELLKAKMLLVALMMASATMFVACEESDVDPDDDDNKKPDTEEPNKPGEENKDGIATESPVLNFEKDANGNLNVSWENVTGAVAYEASAYAVSFVGEAGEEALDPKEEAFNQPALEATSFSFAMKDGYRYEVSVRTLGKEGYADATEASVIEFFNYTAPTTVEAGELSAIIGKLLEAETDPTSEVVFALVAGREYTLADELDFQAHPTTLKSVANVGTEEEPVIVENGTHAVVTYKQAGVIRHADILNVVNISFDCTEQDLKAAGTQGAGQYSGGFAPIEPSKVAPATAKPTAGGHPAYELKAINMDGCYFKNIKAAIYSHGGGAAWGLNSLTINNCVVQCANEGTYGSDVCLIDFYCYGTYEGGDLSRYVAVKDITITNSTIYNAKNVTKNNRFIRFTNNGVLNDVFGSHAATVIFDHNTLYNVFSYKEFGNNTTNNAAYNQTLTNNIIVDCWRLSKYFQGNCTKTIDNNIAWWTGDYQDTDGVNSVGKLPDDEGLYSKENNSTIADPALTGLKDAVLNFEAEDGLGITVTTSAKQGDPRWQK